MKRFPKKMLIAALYAGTAFVIFGMRVGFADTESTSESKEAAIVYSETNDVTSSDSQTIRSNTGETSEDSIDSTSETTSSSNRSDTGSTTVDSSTAESEEKSPDNASDSVYDISSGLDPTYRSRSDLKVSLSRSARSVSSVPYISAGDPSTPKQDFIDISSHNGEITVEQFKLIKSYGVSAVVVKLTEATSYRNPLAASQIANAKAAGLIVHAYHYSWFTTEAQAKAEAIIL